MKIEILWCKNCHLYTIKKICAKCSAATVTPKPAKYSPEDKYGEYRRRYKKTLMETVAESKNQKEEERKG